MSLIIDEMLAEGKLTEQEYQLFTTPMCDLGGNTLSAVQISDKVDAYLREKNKHFIPKPVQNVMLISDCIAGGAIKSMADGKMYDSKSKYYQHLKEKGCFINESPMTLPKPQLNEISGKDIKNVIDILKSR